MSKLNGFKVAILIENGFEEVAMTEPREALRKQGAQTSIVSPRLDHVIARDSIEWSDEFR